MPSAGVSNITLHGTYIIYYNKIKITCIVVVPYDVSTVVFAGETWKPLWITNKCWNTILFTKTDINIHVLCFLREFHLWDVIALPFSKYEVEKGEPSINRSIIFHHFQAPFCMHSGHLLHTCTLYLYKICTVNIESYIFYLVEAWPIYQLNIILIHGLFNEWPWNSEYAHWFDQRYPVIQRTFLHLQT